MSLKNIYLLTQLVFILQHICIYSTYFELYISFRRSLQNQKDAKKSNSKKTQEVST